LRGPGHVPVVQDNVRLDVDEPLIITVSRGSRVVGKLAPLVALGDLRRLAGLPDDGALGDGQRRLLPGVTLRRVTQSGWIAHPNTGHVPSADDGSFAFEGVAPGTWHLSVHWWESSVIGPRVGFEGKDAVVAKVEVRDGVTTEITPDLSSLLSGSLDGLVFLNGRPAANLRLQLRAVVGKTAAGNDDEYTRYVTTDGDGRFQLRTLTGDYEVVGWTDRTQLRAAERGVVVAGVTTAQTFQLQSGTMRFRLLDTEGAPVAGVRIDMIAAGA